MTTKKPAQGAMLRSLLAVLTVLALATAGIESSYASVVGHTKRVVARKGTHVPTVSIGEIYSATGGNATTFGIPIDQGLTVGLDEIQQSGFLKGVVKAQLSKQDDASQVSTGVTDFNKDVSAHDQIVIEAGYTPIAQAITPIANSTHTLFINVDVSSAGLSAQHQYEYGLDDGVDPTKSMIAYVAKTAHIHRVGLIYDEDNAALVSLAGSYLKDLQADGVATAWATSQGIQSTDTDFSSVLTNVRNANVQAVVLLVVPPQAGNLLLQMQQDGGFSKVTKIGHLGWSTQVSTIAGRTAAAGAIFNQPWAIGSPGSASFRAQYLKAYDREPSAYAALGHDAAWLVAVAIKQLVIAGKTVTGTSVSEQLRKAAVSQAFRSHALIAKFQMGNNHVAVYPGVVTVFGPKGNIQVAGQ